MSGRAQLPPISAPKAATDTGGQTGNLVTLVHAREGWTDGRVVNVQSSPAVAPQEGEVLLPSLSPEQESLIVHATRALDAEDAIIREANARKADVFRALRVAGVDDRLVRRARAQLSALSPDQLVTLEQRERMLVQVRNIMRRALGMDTATTERSGD